MRIFSSSFTSRHDSFRMLEHPKTMLIEFYVLNINSLINYLSESGSGIRNLFHYDKIMQYNVVQVSTAHCRCAYPARAYRPHLLQSDNHNNTKHHPTCAPSFVRRSVQYKSLIGPRPKRYILVVREIVLKSVVIQQRLCDIIC